MGRTHPHFHRSPPDTALPMEQRLRAQPGPRHQPPLPPGPVERSRSADGNLTKIMCSFLLCFFRER